MFRNKIVPKLSPALLLLLISTSVHSVVARVDCSARALDPAPATQTPTPTPSQTPVASPGNQSSQVQKTKEKRGSWILAPIPVFSPAVGAGIVPVVGYVFNFSQNDKKSPPSTVGFVGGFTNNGSRFGAVGGRLYFNENKYQATFAVLKMHVFVDFYGIGRLPGRDPAFVNLRTDGHAYFGEFLRNVGKDIFIGARFQRRRLDFDIDGNRPKGGFEIPDVDRDSVSAALGVKLQRDKRDSVFYPTKGSLFEIKADFFDQAFGSIRQYQTYKVAYNAFHSINENRVIAYRGMACAANQNVPFYDLCFFGFNNDLRGYTAGQFQDRRMFALQGELRQKLKGRFGMVVFGGVGGVASRWGDFRSSNLLPAGGAGLRFTLDKRNRINYRVDFGIGREGPALIIGVGEAF